MAARTRRVKLSDEWREKIRASVIVNKLMDCIEGKKELSANQIKAANILLKKIIPDLSNTTLQGDPDKPLNLAPTIQIVRDSETDKAD